ncbi:MAG: class I SAM-dependent methyltransferase [Gemmatimonadota bacterium]
MRLGSSMDNYEFCAQWVVQRRPGTGVRVLDYGCGAGEIVAELRRRAIDGFGCDVFYEGGDASRSVDPTLLEDIIKRMDGNTIPFESASFDFVTNNQVMEHVEDLDAVLAEIHRVLKPGGTVLSLFPDKGVWREGHCGVPFLHWFAKGSRPRVYYAALCRMLGLGYHKGNKDVLGWSRDFCDWLDRWTYYRARQEIDSAYEKYFCDIRHIEDHWLQLRFGGQSILFGWLPASIQRLVVRKLGCLIFVARKPL